MDAPGNHDLTPPTATLDNRPRFVQQTYSLGPAPINKALALAAAIEDEEIIRKLAQPQTCPASPISLYPLTIYNYCR